MRSLPAGLVIAVVFATGCGSNGQSHRPVDAGSSDTGQLAADAPADAGDRDAGSRADVSAVDGADAAGDAPSGPVSFVLTNSTGRTIYIQSSGFSGQAYWSLVQAGMRLPVDNTCEACDCALCSSCGVCGRSLARVTELAPGAQHRWTWDGLIWEVVPDGCRAGLACEQDRRIPSGVALDVAVTYSASFAVDTSFGADDQLIGTPLMATVRFTNTPGTSIDITATP